MNNPVTQQTPTRLLRLPEVMSRVGYRRSKILAEVAIGRFPRPVKHGRSSFWVEAEVDAWVRERISSRGHSPISTEPKLVTERELAEVLGVSVSFLKKYRTLSPPRVPFLKVGTSVRYDLNEARAAIRSAAR